MAVLSGAVGWIGCGGEATVDVASTGTGGTSSGTTSSSFSSSSSSSSGIGGGPGSLCAEACAKLDGCLTGGIECTSSCMAASDGCVGEQDAMLMCIIDEPVSTVCEMPTTCYQEIEAFHECRGIFDMYEFCNTGSGPNCQCSIPDNLGNDYRSECVYDGYSSCACSLNGADIGTCSFGGELECHPWLNCCASLLFVPALPD